MGISKGDPNITAANDPNDTIGGLVKDLGGIGQRNRQLSTKNLP